MPTATPHFCDELCCQVDTSFIVLTATKCSAPLPILTHLALT